MLPTNYCLVLIAITCILNVESITAAPSMPSDCQKRMEAMDRSMKIGLLVSNSDQILFQNESQVNEDYCM